MKQEVTYKTEDIVEILRHIQEIVVSLARLGSAASDMSEEEWRNAVTEFILNHDVANKLSSARRVLSSQFDDEAKNKDVSELEKLMENIEYWSYEKSKN